MEGLIASGLDLINLIQWTAANMDMRKLKEFNG